MSGAATATVAVILAAGVMGVLGTRRRSVLALVGLGVAAGMSVGTACWTQWSEQVALVESRPAGEFSLEVVGDPVAGPFGSTSEARVTLPDVLSGARVRIAWPKTTELGPAEAG
jgi:hypothetical protein